MDRAVMIALLSNASILLILSVVHNPACVFPFKQARLRQAFSGLLIGLACIAVMSVPFSVQPGIFLDTRSVFISITALLFGPVQTVIVAVTATIFQLSIGGAGTLPGLMVIAASALIGLAWRRWLYPRAVKWRAASIYLMSLTVHAAMLACMALLPYPGILAGFSAVVLPVMLVFPITTVILCLLLLRQQNYETIRDQLQLSEAQLKKTGLHYQRLFQEMVEAFTQNEIIFDVQGAPVNYRFISVNTAFEKLTGFQSADIVGKTVTDVMPDDQSYWLNTYHKVALSGETVRFENYAHSLDKYFEVSAYHTSPKQFACTFSDVTKRVRAEEETSKVITRLQSLINNSPSPIVILDEKGKIIEVSNVARRILGLPDKDTPQKELTSIAPPEIIKKVLYVLSRPTEGYQLLESVDVFEFEGDRRYFESRLFPIHAPSQSEKLFGYLAIDVTDRIKVEDALRASGERYSSYIENAPYAVFVVDEKGACLEANHAAAAITGYTKEQLINRNIRDMVPLESMNQAMRAFQQLTASGHLSVAMPFLHKSGAVRWWMVDVVKLAENRYLAFAGDITDKKEAEAELVRLSYHDCLTGLFNRRYFEEETKRVDNPSQLPLSVFIGDINGVKLVNDTLGHAEGDRLIGDCAKIIRDCCRSGDTVARIGGDEFGILMPKTDNATAIDVLSKIQAALSTFDSSVCPNLFTHSISLGFGTKRFPEEDITKILHIAEEYMYQRKLLEHNSSHSTIISSIKAAMIEKNPETEAHAERLVVLSKKMATLLQLSQTDQDRLVLLATLHDIGKVGVSDSILTKNGILTADEWVEMKRHPEIGYRIAVASPVLIPVAESILCHHERWDGQGYPQGLLGENTPLLSRILAVVDAYDAMTQDRPYRKAMSHDEAITEIKLNAGTQFDPHIVQTFVENNRD